MRLLNDFHVALTFLTVLGRATITDNEAISRSMRMYPLVGALLGLCLRLGALLPLAAWPLAWILVGANIFLTRGLHWDGWADIWDAWGSGPERFWTALKDSRLGAFGAIGLIFGIGLQAALLAQALETKNIWPVFLAPVLGRFSCLLLARISRCLGRPGLGKNALDGANGQALLLGGATTLAALATVPLAHALCATLLTVLAVALLHALGKSHGGINGDFLGAAIIAGELSALLPLAWLLHKM